MPIDYVVDASAGSDANNGEFGNPVASVWRAAEIAAMNETSPGREAGRIFVAAGTYEPPVERFPILVPTDFDLIGAGRGLTTIRFTGEVRVSPTDPAIEYWGGTAIMAGRRVQGLTLEAEPRPTGYSCSGIFGIDCINDNTVIEDVHVLLPEPIDSDRSFNNAITMRGINGRITSSRIERMRRNGGIELHDSAIMVDDIEVRFAHCKTYRCRGTRIARSRFEEGGYAGLSGDVRFEQNTFRGVWISAGGGGARIGPNNDIRGVGVLVSDDTIVEDNDIRGVFTLECARGSPVIRGNQIRHQESGGNIHFLLRVSFSSTPRIENNVFSLYNAATNEIPWFARAIKPFQIRSEADFGGGAQGSSGGNRFGCMHGGGAWEFNIPGGGTVYMNDNFWRHPDRSSWPFLVESGTTVIAENPQRDSTLCIRLELPQPPFRRRWSGPFA